MKNDLMFKCQKKNANSAHSTEGFSIIFSGTTVSNGLIITKFEIMDIVFSEKYAMFYSILC